tara:strand:- start:5647 stop:5850 length:204 start_codon:yes stop_codon:yes gene_type:complete
MVESAFLRLSVRRITDALCINPIKQLKQFPYSTLISIKNRHLFGGFLLPVNKWYNHCDNVINLFKEV